MLNITKGKPRLSVRDLVLAIVVAAVILTGGRWYLELTPRVREYRRNAALHARSAREWAEYTQLSKQGAVFISKNIQGRSFLSFYHFIPGHRPESLKEAKAFDRECAEIAAICRDRASYHAEMSEKWRRAASRPWADVLPDPPPPISLGVSGMRDISV